MAEQDGIRFEKQKKDFDSKGWFTMTDGTKSNSASATAKIPISKKFGDDVLLPKNPLSGYMCFTKAHCKEIMEELKTNKVTLAMKQAG